MFINFDRFRLFGISSNHLALSFLVVAAVLMATGGVVFTVRKQFQPKNALPPQNAEALFEDCRAAGSDCSVQERDAVKWRALYAAEIIGNARDSYGLSSPSAPAWRALPLSVHQVETQSEVAATERSLAEYRDSFRSTARAPIASEIAAWELTHVRIYPKEEP